jgi:hypothetical protein
MASQIDFVIAAGLFLTFIAALMFYLINYTSSYFNLSIISDLRTVAFGFFNTLFGSKGVPAGWESYSYTPVKVGLITDLYRMPIVITETNGTERTNYTINVSMVFDSGCLNKTWNTTVRVYDENNTEMPNQLFDQAFCSEYFVNQANIVFNLTIAASASKKYFVYFSPQRQILPANYSFTFPTAENYTVTRYPEEKLTTVSVDKLKTLRNLSYEEVVRTLGTEYKIYVEVGK